MAMPAAHQPWTPRPLGPSTPRQRRPCKRQLASRLGALAGLALVVLGCIGAPSPLAPNVSGSVGVPQSGVLTNGVELPAKGPGFARLRAKSPNYWGNPRLVDAIQDSARAVSEKIPGGEPL